MNTGGFKGQVAIVTGSGLGIGSATVLELARAGTKVSIAEIEAGGQES